MNGAYETGAIDVDDLIFALLISEAQIYSLLISLDMPKPTSGWIHETNIFPTLSSERVEHL